MGSAKNGQKAIVVECEAILDHLPPVVSCFAYGSGAFRQQGQKGVSHNVLDLILSVEDSKAWHQQNMDISRNSADSVPYHANHYPLLFSSVLGAGSVTQLQRYMGAGVWFIPNAAFPHSATTRPVKYGVVEHSDLLDDLRNWNTLYLSGRLHKPVQWIVPPYSGSSSSMNDTSSELERALLWNKSAALTAAFLLQWAAQAEGSGSSGNNVFAPGPFFTRIAGLSYMGDVRMGVAEDPNKVSNIVKGTGVDAFQDYYRPALASLKDMEDEATRSYASIIEDGIMTGSTVGLLPDSDSAECRRWQTAALCSLPVPVRQQFLAHCGLPSNGTVARDVTAVADAVGKKQPTPQKLALLLSAMLAGVVRRHSFTQTAKGIISAGIGGSIKYALRKVGKRIGLV
eukprot:Clim_evm10s252 gene=Clim_evmTU10s252